MIETIQGYLGTVELFLATYWSLLIYVSVGYLILYELVNLSWFQYLHKINHDYIHHLKWKMFQLNFPKENLKSPKAMEQVVASMHGTVSFGIPWRKKYFKGIVEDWFSLEIVGRNTGMSFYARVPDSHENFFKSAFFAQYPEIEMIEVDDYMHGFPEKLPDDTYTLFATDYLLGGKQVYPIKTYEFFDSPDEDQRLDPMATLAEAASNLNADEAILMQILIRPTWRPKDDSDVDADARLLHEYDEVIEKITGRKAKHGNSGSGIGSFIWQFMKNIFVAFFQSPEWGHHAEEEKPQAFKIYTPGENDALKAIDNKMSKNLFQTIFRFIYIDRKDSFTGKNVLAVFASVTQFSDRATNSFKPGDGSSIWTEKLPWVRNSPKWFFKKRRLDKRREKMYEAYKERVMPLGHRAWGDLKLETSVLSSEEIATIFHPPGKPIGAQRLAPLETKKGGPPSTLPLIEE